MNMKNTWTKICIFIAFVISFSGCGFQNASNDFNETEATESLVTAVRLGSYEGIKEAIANGGDVNAQILTSRYTTIPKKMCIHEYLRTDAIGSRFLSAEYLLQCGANINYLDRYGYSPLMNAAAVDDVSLCKKYIQQYGADIHLKTKNGQTALEVAAEHGAENAVLYLFSLGATPTTHTLEAAIKNNYGNYRNQKTAKIVIEKLAEQGVNTKLNTVVKAALIGDSASVIQGCESNDFSEEQLREIGYHTAAFCHSSALEVCVKNGFTQEDWVEYLDTVKIAVRYGNENTLQWLIEHKPDEISVQEIFKVLVNGGQISAVRGLLEEGFSWERNELTVSSLSIAAENGDLAMVNLLLEKSGELSHEIMAQALHTATFRGQTKVAEKLLETTSFTQKELCDNATFASGNLDLLKLYVAYGADVKENRSLLQFAIESGYYDTLKYLLEIGVSANEVENASAAFDSPLYTAVSNGYIDLTELLIQHGADVNFVNKKSDYYQSALSVAAQSSLNITRLLIESGADVNMLNADGSTPLMSAIAFNQVDCVEILLNSGADINVQNDAGITAMDLMKKSKNKKMQMLFRERNLL